MKNPSFFLTTDVCTVFFFARVSTRKELKKKRPKKSHLTPLTKKLKIAAVRKTILHSPHIHFEISAKLLITHLKGKFAWLRGFRFVEARVGWVPEEVFFYGVVRA